MDSILATATMYDLWMCAKATILQRINNGRFQNLITAGFIYPLFTTKYGWFVKSLLKPGYNHAFSGFSFNSK